MRPRELNDINGGSIRLYIGHAGRLTRTPSSDEALQRLRISESEMGLDAPHPYERFRMNAERVRDELRATCERLTAEGSTIHVYGASTKGDTILQYAGIGRNLIPTPPTAIPTR